MLRLNIPAGAQLLLGAPAQPMPSEQADALAATVAAMDGVSEAHLPQCFVPGVMKQPAQVLVMVVEPPADPDRVCASIGQALNAVLPQVEHLDLLPLEPGSSLLDAVRRAGCRIYSASQDEEGRVNGVSPGRPWWKIW